MAGREGITIDKERKEIEILTKKHDIYIRKSGKGYDVDIFRKDDEDTMANDHVKTMDKALQFIAYALKEG